MCDAMMQASHPCRAMLLSCLCGQAVVLNNILRNEINAGYSFTEMSRIKTFNGQSVRNLRHLVTMVESCREEWSIFEFHGTRVSEIIGILGTENTHACE